MFMQLPDLDALFQQQAVELDPKRREATLHKMQQFVYERSVYAPIWQLALSTEWTRVGESGSTVSQALLTRTLRRHHDKG